MRYLILGATEARDGRGEPVGLGGPRVRSLLTALALRADSPAPVPVEVLIGEVWADADSLPADAPAALQALVGRLRRALGRDAVQSLPGGYQLSAGPDDVDLHRFQRLAGDGTRALDAGDPATAAAALREALELWRGPALADLPGQVGAAARPEALRRATEQRRFAAELALGHADAVLPALRELAAQRLLDEPVQTLLLRALRDTGRTAEALEAYEAVRREIADRLGADPGAELRCLYAELLDSGTAPEGAYGAGTPHEGEGPRAPVSRLPENRASTSPYAEQHRDDPPPAPAPPPEPARPEPAPQGNLRARLTSFVGREADLATLRGDLSRSRLVTLTGPGGSGKTRLAEQAAAAATALSAETAYPDGAWLVELAPLDQPAAVPGAVLSALGRRDTALFTGGSMETPRPPAPESPATDEPATERASAALAPLLEYCAHRRLLLVLDNCEHVIDAAARLAETLLAHCPGIGVLATSREPLGVPGESVRPVEPLPPEPAHRLFADRATAASPGFRTDSDPDAVAEICRRLDGLPLAIELAAARLRSLTPRQIAGRLDDRFRLLTGGSRTVLPRQQTLRAVVDWSWDLLDESERTVVRRLSVFAGGCTLSAAEYVCAGPAADADGADVSEDGVLDLLGALIDKSILVTDRPPPLAETGLRYRMLETIHEYAKERAAGHPAERAAAERRHTGQIVRFVTAAEPRLRSAEQLGWFPRLEADLDNIRAVLHRAVLARDEETLNGLVRNMGWFWWLRNYRDEGAQWTQAALGFMPSDRGARDAETEIRYREFELLYYFLLYEQHGSVLSRDDEENQKAVERDLLETFSRPQPAAGRFPGLLWPFTAFLSEGSEAVARLMRQSVATCRTYGGPWELAVSLLFRAHVTIDAPHGLNGADSDLPEIDTLARSTGDRWLISQVSGLRAEIDTQHGRYDEARGEYVKAMRYAKELGAFTEIPVLQARIAENWYRKGDSEQAERLAQESVEEADRLGITDARAFGGFLRALIAVDAGEPQRARKLWVEADTHSTLGTPPAMFEVAMRMLDGRIAAAEGAPVRDALWRVRESLRRGLEAGSPETVLASCVLGAASIAAGGGLHGAARWLADAALTVRGELAPSVPELRMDAAVRERAGGAPLPDVADLAVPLGPAASGAHDPARTVRRAIVLLDTLVGAAD